MSTSPTSVEAFLDPLVGMTPARVAFRFLAQSPRLPVASSIAFVSTTAFPTVPEPFEQARRLVLALKEGDAGAARECAGIMARHPLLRGFDGIVSPAPRSTPERTAHLALAKALVSRGVGTAVQILVRRSKAVPSSRLLRRQGLPGVPVDQHVDSMESEEPPSVSPVLFVDDVFTSGATLRAAALVLRRAGWEGAIWGATAGYAVPAPSGNPLTSVRFVV